MNIGLSRILKIGTSASGHWGHAGRPGLIGGSAPGEGEERIMTQTSFGFGEPAFTTGRVAEASLFPKSRDTLNKVYLAKIQGDGEAILKSEYQEQDEDNREMGQFYASVLDATETNLSECSMVRREVIASEVDDILKVGLVPKTVLKDVDAIPVQDESLELEGPSSCQAFVEGFKSFGKMQYPDIKRIVDNNRETVYTAAAFDYLIGSCDRHRANVGVGKDGKLTLIDNGYSFAKNPEGAWNGNLADRALSQVNIYEKSEFMEEYKRIGKLAIGKERAIAKVFDRYGLPKAEQEAFWYRAADMREKIRPLRQGENPLDRSDVPMTAITGSIGSDEMV